MGPGRYDYHGTRTVRLSWDQDGAIIMGPGRYDYHGTRTVRLSWDQDGTIIMGPGRYDYHGTRTVRLSRFHDYYPTLLISDVRKIQLKGRG